MERYLEVRTADDVERHLAAIRASAERARLWITAQTGDPLDLLRHMKFEPVGFHPIEDRGLNVIEQINQTWTYAVALSAARLLLDLHPEAGGFRVAPGAHMALPLDIMSEEPGLVGAETFAAVDPRNNRKLAMDLGKLAARSEAHRYVFFMSPRYPGARRQPAFERDGVQVWSVEV
ncbi:hypothetical protein [Caulobacter radicis]|uniref:Uncharacterized protein n=1 Tax=Caulobacter radicis TaxID=2172650 RepID=A0A2T9IXT2_9CAUL|nr:hypothetical protein [Caulobacter radicis]PVM71916.1 hypothetical protein DDF65_22735 [Caulobacter radicis]